MKITNERKSDDWIFDIDLTPEEHELLVDYACNNMSIEEVDSALINWAVVDIIKKQLERGEPICDEQDDEYI